MPEDAEALAVFGLEAVGVSPAGIGLKEDICTRVQLAAIASICVKLQFASANVRIGSGFDFAASAVERLTSASPRKRNTPPPPLQATAYTILMPRFCMRVMTLRSGRIMPVSGSTS